MDLTLTTADPQGRHTDHLLDLPADATVAGLATALAGEPQEEGAPPPVLYLDGRALRPELPVAHSGIREGAVLGLGAPVPAAGRLPAWAPPEAEPALVEIRHVSGPGSGTVWRLGPGSHEAGTDRGCVLRLPGGGAPEGGVWITVRTDGTLSFLLPPDANPARCGLRSLTPPPPVDPETGTPLTDEEPAGPHDGGPGGHTTAPDPPGPDGLPVPEEPPPPGVLPPPGDDSEEWPPYADLALGDHLLRFGPVSEPDAAVNPAADGVGLEYNRPPRIAPHLDADSLRMPGPPSKPRDRAFPLLMVLMPLIMGMVMVSLFRSFYFLIFIFFTPLMALGNWIAGRRNGRRAHADALRLFRLRRASLEREVRQASVEERALRNVTFPDPATVLLTATGPGALLWQRRRHDPDHLALRFGTITRASLRRITDSARESNHQTVHWRLADVPFALEMTDRGVLGLTGPDDSHRAVARWAVAQSAVLHSPRDLRIVVLTSDTHREDWAWVRWLPHLRNRRGGSDDGPVIHLGNDPESTAHRVSELLADIKARTDAARSPMGAALHRDADVLVVLDGARRLRDVPGVIDILTTGPGVRVFSLCVDERERLLPEECTGVVTATGGRVSVRVTGAPPLDDLRADLVTRDWCEQVARALSPVRDVTPDGSSGLPDEVRLLPLLDQEPPNADALLKRWSRRPAETAFVLGAGYEGPFRLDLVRDGPHGLVGGTTGAGKSELLQTMIGSLAAVNRPDELTFVLVDYKGGSAFRECSRLPHTLGMITDLDGHLVERALASLAAELRRRERVLAAAEAKDHTEYRARRARDPQLPPLPRLLIVIDEFATLVRELPDFVPGMVNLAQRGRSLGLHLILATQRPGGSVNNEIKANTNLRISLRVTDRAESQDIIDAPDAANISAATPGRALVRRGATAPVPVQSAWAGAERATDAAADAPAETSDSRPVRGTRLTWQGLGRAPQHTGDDHDEELLPTSGEEPPTDLRALVTAITEATERLPDFAQQPSPWLPALPRLIDLDDLPPAPPPRAGALPVVPYALLDLPDLQERRLGTMDLETFGHLYVVGSPRSGRTQALRSMAGAAAGILSSADLHIHGIDAAGGGLLALEELPHSGAIVPRHDSERLERLLLRLAAELTERQRQLSSRGCAGISELRAALPEAERPAHILFLIDGWDALSAVLDDYDGGRLYGEIVRLLREGAAAGIHVVATSERILLGGRLAAHNDRRLLLRQAEKTDYQLAGMNRHQVPDHVPPGRGWHAPGGVETQIALLPGPPATTDGADEAGEIEQALLAGERPAPDQAEALRRIARKARDRDNTVPAARRPFRVAELPTLIGYQEVADRIPEELRRPLWALVGVGGDGATPLGQDLAAGGGSYLVVGPARSGRSTTLATMCVSLLVGGTSLVVITPRDSPLRRLGVHDLARVLPDPDPSVDELQAALDAQQGRPTVVVIDDADLLINARADKLLRKLAVSGRDAGQGLILAGSADSFGALGWVSAARRSRQAILLGPKSITEGDFIGARLSADQVRMPLVPGRGWTAGPGGLAVAVQVPLTVFEG